MRLLKITRKKLEEFDYIFEDTEKAEIEEVAPAVIDGETDVKVKGNSVSDYDAVFAQIPQKNAVFGRVLLEMIEEEGVKTNCTSTAFFIMSKKNYLYYVLHEREIPSPKATVINSPKSVRNIGNEIDLPVVARRFKSYRETDAQKLESIEEIEDFAEGEEDQETVLSFQEYSEGEKYRLLVAGEQIVSLKDKSDHWEIGSKNLQYSNVSSDLEEMVKNAVRSLGAPVAEVLVREGKVVDMNPNPDLEMYTDISGKNAYEAVAEALKEEG